jgi:hypothetical protein
MAHQSDWQKYQAAWRQWQASGATGKPPQEVRDYLRAQNDARVAEAKAKGYGPAKLGELQRPKKSPAKVDRQGNIVATMGSDCFDFLGYLAAEGVVVASFANPTRGTWAYPMDRATAKAWLDGDLGSLGEAFNQFFRE